MWTSIRFLMTHRPSRLCKSAAMTAQSTAARGPRLESQSTACLARRRRCLLTACSPWHPAQQGSNSLMLCAAWTSAQRTHWSFLAKRAALLQRPCPRLPRMKGKQKNLLVAVPCLRPSHLSNVQKAHRPAENGSRLNRSNDWPPTRLRSISTMRPRHAQALA